MLNEELKTGYESEKILPEQNGEEQ